MQMASNALMCSASGRTLDSAVRAHDPLSVLCQHQANLFNMVSSDTSNACNLSTNENNVGML